MFVAPQGLQTWATVWREDLSYLSRHPEAQSVFIPSAEAVPFFVDVLRLLSAQARAGVVMPGQRRSISFTLQFDSPNADADLRRLTRAVDRALASAQITGFAVKDMVATPTATAETKAARASVDMLPGTIAAQESHPEEIEVDDLSDGQRAVIEMPGGKTFSGRIELKPINGYGPYPPTFAENWYRLLL